MRKKNIEFSQLTPEAMKEIKGGVFPAKTNWRCFVNGVYHDTCYSVQPQQPCGYADPCTAIGSCASRDLCVLIEP